MGKPFRCKLSMHSFENKIRGKNNLCKSCGQKIYVKTWKEELKDSFLTGEGGEGGGA